MGFLDELKKLTQPYDDEDEEFDTFVETPRREVFEERRPSAKSDDRRGKVVNIHATTQLKVVLVKPERFENAAEIADHLKDKRTVVLNLVSSQAVEKSSRPPQERRFRLRRIPGFQEQHRL